MATPTKPLPQRAFGDANDVDPLTGHYTPGMESRRTYGQQDKPKPPKTPEPPNWDHWQCG